MYKVFCDAKKGVLVGFRRDTMCKYQAIADKYVGQRCKLYTLDGVKDALVCGRLNQFASIAARDGSASIEVNWPTVARKMEGDATFYAC